jgi:hypothetical protein
MAPSARRIPQEEWDAQEDTLRHLYLDEELPLQSKKQDKRTVVTVMEKEHGFLARCVNG